MVTSEAEIGRIVTRAQQCPPRGRGRSRGVLHGVTPVRVAEPEAVARPTSSPR
jgi:hypothetical protein